MITNTLKSTSVVDREYNIEDNELNVCIHDIEARSDCSSHIP